MVKVDGYNPEANDWFWAEYKANGNVLFKGKPKLCIDCHVSGDNDYLLLRPLDKSIE